MSKLETLAATLIYDGLRSLTKAREVLAQALAAPPPKDFTDDSPVKEYVDAMKQAMGSGHPLDHTLARVIRELAVELVTLDAVALDLEGARLPLPVSPPMVGGLGLAAAIQAAPPPEGPNHG